MEENKESGMTDIRFERPSDSVSSASFSTKRKRTSSKQPKPKQESVYSEKISISLPLLSTKDSADKTCTAFFEIMRMLSECPKFMEIKSKYSVIKFNSIVLNLRTCPTGGDCMGPQICWTFSDTPIDWNIFAPNISWPEKTTKIPISIDKQDWSLIDGLSTKGKIQISIKSNDTMDARSQPEVEFHVSAKGDKCQNMLFASQAQTIIF